MDEFTLVPALERFTDAASLEEIKQAHFEASEIMASQNRTLPLMYEEFFSGFVMLRNGELARALELLVDVLEKAKLHSLRVLQHYVEYHLGILLSRHGDLGDSILLLKQAERCQEIDLTHLLSYIYNAQAHQVYYSGDIPKTKHYLNKAFALELTEKQLSSHPILNNIALCETELGNVERGEELFVVAQSILQRFPSSKGIYQYHTAYATHFFISKQYFRAIEEHEKALKLVEGFADKYLHANELLEYCQCAVEVQNKTDEHIDITERLNCGLSIALELKSEKFLKGFAEILKSQIALPGLSAESRMKGMEQLLALQSKVIELKSAQEKGFIRDLFRLTASKAEFENSMSLQNNLALISRIGETLSTSKDLAKSMLAIYEDIQTIIELDAFAIGLYDKKTNTVNYDYFIEHGEFVDSISVDCSTQKSLSGYCIQNRESLCETNLTPNKISEILGVQKSEIIYVTQDKCKHRSVMFSPILLKDEVLGIVNCQVKKPYRYREYHSSLLDQLTSYLAVGLKNLQQRELLESQKRRLHKVSVTDALTSIYNRQSLPQHLKQARSEVSSSSPLGLVLIDIDYFKQYNDTYGHVAGDALLRELSTALKESFSLTTHKHFRYGGDELLVLLKGDDFQAMSGFVLDFQNKVKTLGIPNKASGCSDVVTVSIGGCSFSTGELTNDAMIHQVDELMYKIKHSGKNSSLLAVSANINDVLIE